MLAPVAVDAAVGAVFRSFLIMVSVVHKPHKVKLVLSPICNTIRLVPKKNLGGRPPKPPGERASVVMQFRVTRTDADLIKRAARGHPNGVSGWLRERAVRAARRKLQR